MIRIRLQKKGRKKRPIFHIVVADSKVARDGRIIEQVGRYDNVTEKKEVVLNEDRILYWLDTGAQPSDTVRKILRNEGVLYKRHLMMWGKNEEEIEAALAEWKSYRDSKEDGNDSRKDKYKNILAAEEKEFKDQVQKKAAKAAVELESESSDEETATEETEATAETEATEEVATEETTDEAPAEEEVVEEAAPEAEAKEAAEEVEEKVAEATEEPATEEAVVEETPAEETKDEAPAEEEKEEAAEEAKAEASSTETSSAMTAKDAIDHINNTDMDALKGFISDDESRKTVLAAWESKQSEG